MKNFIITGFNENYWNRWGISWIASLKELAEYKGAILIVDFGLCENTKKRIVEFGCDIIKSISQDYQTGIFEVIEKLSIDNKGIVATWSSDVFFQDNIDDIFEISKEDILYTKSSGFYSVPLQKVKLLKEVFDLSLLDNRPFHEFFKYYSKFKRIDNTWNFADVANLQISKEKLTYKNQVQKVIHPKGTSKNFLDGKNILFWERYESIFQKYSDEKSTGPKIDNKFLLYRTNN